MRLLLSMFVFLSLTLSQVVQADLATDLQACAVRQANEARLKCYDSLARSQSSVSPAASGGAQPSIGKKPTSPSDATSSSCSCGSGSVCTGPRGGRYCVTSGGNKRYVK